MNSWSRACTSPRRLILAALPWKRLRFPAPFPPSSSATLQQQHHRLEPTCSRQHTRIWACITLCSCSVCNIRLLELNKSQSTYLGPKFSTASTGPARRKSPASFSSPTVRNSRVFCGQRQALLQISQCSPHPRRGQTLARGHKQQTDNLEVYVHYRD